MQSIGETIYVTVIAELEYGDALQLTTSYDTSNLPEEGEELPGDETEPPSGDELITNISISKEYVEQDDIVTVTVSVYTQERLELSEIDTIIGYDNELINFMNVRPGDDLNIESVEVNDHDLWTIQDSVGSLFERMDFVEDSDESEESDIDIVRGSVNFGEILTLSLMMLNLLRLIWNLLN